MNIIAETELILTSENKIYHLNLSEEEIADDIILVGDPGRVEIVSRKFDKIEHKVQHREFITHTGVLNNKKISVISTGIGTDNIDIVINELDALVNINFKTRKVNRKKKSLNLIRIGTSGSLQSHIKVDTFLVSAFGLGFDNIAHFYAETEILEKKISESYVDHANWPEELSSPYIIKASDKLFSLFSDLPKGITATAAGFYGPQGRTLRIKPKIIGLENKMRSFRFKDYQITNFEMETSALYYLGQTLGHNTITICAIIGNRINKKYSSNAEKTIDKMINLVLKKLSKK